MCSYNTLLLLAAGILIDVNAVCLILACSDVNREADIEETSVEMMAIKHAASEVRA